MVNFGYYMTGNWDVTMFMPPGFVVLVVSVRLFWVESVGRTRREVHMVILRESGYLENKKLG